MLPNRKTKHAKSPMASASCPVRDLSSTRVDQSARCPVCESSSPRVGNPRVGVSLSCPVTCEGSHSRSSTQVMFLLSTIYFIFRHKRKHGEQVSTSQCSDCLITRSTDATSNQRERASSYIHCVAKIQNTRLLIIISADVDRFSKFFHWQISEEIW